MTAIATRQQTDNGAIERALIESDLSKLNEHERLSFYKQVCESLGLNPLTSPFAYIRLNNKLTLYARKDATDQLRKLHNISIEKPDIRFEDEWIIVTVAARTSDGRTDSDIGVVNKKSMNGDFGNAVMKSITKAKRRVTLSICGLGFLDETEVETIPNAQTVPVEVISPEIESLRNQIKSLCNQLNKAGDEIEWKKSTLETYSQDKFQLSFVELKEGELEELIDDLGDRLSTFEANHSMDEQPAF